MRSYDELVAEGRDAVRQEQDAKWVLGDLAVEVAPGIQNTPRKFLREEELAEIAKLEQYAKDIGFSYEKLLTRRRVAQAWPVDTRVASWTVHRELASKDNRFDIVKPGMKVNEARRLADFKPQGNERPRSTQEKADLVAELIEDQDVATAIASNPKARASLAAAEARRDEDIEDQMRDRHPNYAKAASSSAVADVIYATSKFRGALRRAAEALRSVDISSDDRDALRHANQQVRDDIDVFESVTLEDDLDAQFAALIEGGQ